jgi:hypothetical protein
MYMDRHDEANSRFSQFCERAKKRGFASVYKVELEPAILRVRGSDHYTRL